MKPLLLIILITLTACAKKEESHIWMPETYKQEILYFKVTTIDPKYIYDTCPEYDSTLMYDITMANNFISSGSIENSSGIHRFYAIDLDTIIEYRPYGTVYTEIKY